MKEDKSRATRFQGAKTFLAEFVVPTGLGIFANQSIIANRLADGRLPSPSEAQRLLERDRRLTEPSLVAALGPTALVSHLVGITVATAAYWAIHTARQCHMASKSKPAESDQRVGRTP